MSKPPIAINAYDDTVRAMLAEKGLPCPPEAMEELHQIISECTSMYKPTALHESGDFVSVALQWLGTLLQTFFPMLPAVFKGDAKLGDQWKTASDFAKKSTTQFANDRMTMHMYVRFNESQYLRPIAEQFTGQRPHQPGTPVIAAVNDPRSIYHANDQGILDTSLNRNYPVEQVSTPGSPPDTPYFRSTGLTGKHA